jgi:hypothetical protein
MSWHNSPAALRAEWQDRVEISLETGESPVLDLGANNGVLDSLPALMALQGFAEQRTDITTPTLVSGGNSLLWMAALVHEPSAAHAPALTVVYGGADLATQLGSLATQQVQPPARLQPPMLLPAQLAALFAPGAQAGPLWWEALPFAVAEEATRPANRPEDAPLRQDDPWLAWAAIAVAVVLVVAAFLV